MVQLFEAFFTCQRHDGEWPWQPFCQQAALAASKGKICWIQIGVRLRRAQTQSYFLLTPVVCLVSSCTGLGAVPSGRGSCNTTFSNDLCT